MKKSIIICALACLSIFTGCKKEEIPSLALKEQTPRTVLAYMFHDTNLWDDLTINVNDMENGWDPETDGTLLVYVDASTSITQYDGKPVLLEITHDTTNLIVSRIVKIYPDADATTPAVFRQVQQDVMDMYPADSYGLIVSGHGNGFFVNTPNTKLISGADRWSDNGLDIDVLADNLMMHYDFLIFDACTMAESATLYQLRKATDFVVASVDLSPSSGFAYRSDVRALFTKPKADLFTFAKASAMYYEKNPVEIEELEDAYFTLGVYRMAAMENLAAVTKTVIEELDLKYPDLQNELLNLIGEPGLKNSMYYPRDKALAPTTWYYDFGLLPMLLNSMGEAKMASNLRKALKSVVMQNHNVFPDNFTKDNAKYCDSTANLSFYIPTLEPALAAQDNPFYTRFEWSTASGFTNTME